MPVQKSLNSGVDQAIKLVGVAGRVGDDIVGAEDRWWRGGTQPDVVVEVCVKLQIEPGDVRWPREHNIRGRTTLNAQNGRADKLSEHDVIAATPLVGDPERNAADVQGRSLRQAAEGV